MNSKTTAQIAMHPLRLAFWLSSAWYWSQWWQREALLAMKALEGHRAPDPRGGTPATDLARKRA
jgi:hypothetical protein